MELQQSQANYDVQQCEVIQHLLDVTEVAAATSIRDKSSSVKGSKKVEHNYSDANSEKGYSRNTSSFHQDMVCCLIEVRIGMKIGILICWVVAQNHICIKTFFYPCGTFSKIATVATNRHMSSAEACNELMAYSLVLSCCCYTCCVRRKLRKALNITGGFIDDFLSHLMCCCCALVQEWREAEMRGVYGPEKTKTSPPPSQFMES
ncbi:hypothetical protein DITRI_Ditri16bG0005700 [Diplodiscus trichospermus]